MIYELQLVIVNLNFPDPILQYYTVRTKGGPVVLLYVTGEQDSIFNYFNKLVAKIEFFYSTSCIKTNLCISKTV